MVAQEQAGHRPHDEPDTSSHAPTAHWANAATLLAATPAATLPPRIAEPGMSDESMQRGSGKTWDEWFLILDGWSATGETHKAIADYLCREHGVAGWWAQSITVGYERARGMRDKHQRPNGYSVNASKTVAVPVSQLFAALTDEARRDRWLEPGTLRLRSSKTDRAARFDAPDGTRLAAFFLRKGPAKSSVALQHDTLADAAAVETWRAFWKPRLNRLATLLTEET